MELTQINIGNIEAVQTKSDGSLPTSWRGTYANGAIYLKSTIQHFVAEARGIGSGKRKEFVKMLLVISDDGLALESVVADISRKSTYQ